MYKAFEGFTKGSTDGMGPTYVISHTPLYLHAPSLFHKYPFSIIYVELHLSLLHGLHKGPVGTSTDPMKEWSDHSWPSGCSRDLGWLPQHTQIVAILMVPSIDSEADSLPLLEEAEDAARADLAADPAWSF